MSELIIYSLWFKVTEFLWDNSFTFQFVSG